MNILVTGGFGFIGSYLTDVLSKRGHNVGILDRGIPDYFASEAADLAVYTADITSPIGCKLDRGYDLLIHLAAANDVDSKNALNALSVTTLGTRNCLEFCRLNGIKRFLYFSTFQVYGKESGYVDESTPASCKNDYAITHLFAEEYVKVYQRTSGIEYIILRPTNVYGAFRNRNINRWSLVPNCFIKEAVEKGKITLLTSGKQVRDFVSLGELCNITAVLCERFEEWKNSIFNVASGKSLSIIEVAEKTRIIYQVLFGKECALDIRSDQPACGENLTVSTAKIKSLPYHPSGDSDMDSQIVSVFEMLREA